MKRSSFLHVAIIVLLVIISLVLAYFGYSYLQKYSQRMTLKSKLVDIEQSLVNESFGEINNHLIILSNAQSIIESLKNNDSRNPSIQILLDYANHSMKSSMVYVLDTLGNVVHSTSFLSESGESVDLIGRNYSFRPYFKKAIVGKDCFYPAVGITTNKRGIYFSKPVFSPNSKKVIGVVAIKHNVNILEQALSKLEEVAFITTNDGIVFISNNKEWLFRKVGNDKTRLFSDLIHSRQFNNREIKELPFSLIEREIYIDNNKFLLETKQLDITQWQINVMSTYNPYSKLQHELFYIVIVGMTMLIIFLLMTMLLVRSCRKRMMVEIAFETYKNKQTS